MTCRRDDFPIALQLRLVINRLTIHLHTVISKYPHICFVQLDPNAVQKAARFYHDFLELRFTIQAVGSALPSRNIIAVVQFPWGSQHYLGPLSSSSTMASARFVRVVPLTLHLVLNCDTCLPAVVEAPSSMEMLLKEHVKIIVENDEFCGSMSSAHVQNLVREFPFYEGAMRRFPNWSKFTRFFAEHYAAWRIVEYDVEQHRYLGMTELTPPREQRLVANRFYSSYIRADMLRDQKRSRALEEFREVVLLQSQNSRKPESDDDLYEKDDADMPYLRLSRTELRQLGSARSFRTLNSVNFMRLLEMMHETSDVLFSAFHPIQADQRPSLSTSHDLLLNTRK